MSQNAYEIRLNILNKAKEIAFESWAMKCNEEGLNAERHKRDQMNPPAPTAKDVLKIADDLYKFVSGKGPGM